MAQAPFPAAKTTVSETAAHAAVPAATSPSKTAACSRASPTIQRAMLAPTRFANNALPLATVTATITA